MPIFTNTFTTDKPAWVDSLVAEQATKVALDGKYKQYKRDVLAPNSEVHEYVGPLGVGYLIVEYKTDVIGEWYRVGGVGPDNSQYHDWRRFNEPDGYGTN